MLMILFGIVVMGVMNMMEPCVAPTRVMGGNAEYMNSNYNSKVSDLGSFAEKETKNGVKSEESVHNLTGLKLAIILQVVWLFFWHFSGAFNSTYAELCCKSLHSWFLVRIKEEGCVRQSQPT